MVKFIMKRLTLMIPLLIVVTFMTFMMTYLTNEDPAVTILHAQGKIWIKSTDIHAI